MIQEIFDYLLIRNYLMQANDEFLNLDNVDNKRDQFYYFVRSISMIMQNEEFVLTNEEIQKEISEVVRKYRFDFISDKEINDEVNYIIGRFKEYDKLSESRRNYLIKEWYKDEYKDRLLPLRYHKFLYVNALVISDFANLESLNNPTAIEWFDGYVVTQQCKISKLISYLSTINLMLTRSPDAFTEEDKINLVINFSMITSNLKLSSEELRYMNKTARHIGIRMSEEELKEKILEKI